METSISNDWLPVYKALASPVRLKIIQLLAKKSSKYYFTGYSIRHQRNYYC